MTYEELQKLEQGLDHDALSAKGKAIYREKIRPLVHPQHKGKVVVIDVASGDYEMDSTPSIAVGRLLERHPDCIYTYGVRVGYKAVYRFGSARIPEDDEC